MWVSQVLFVHVSGNIAQVISPMYYSPGNIPGVLRLQSFIMLILHASRTSVLMSVRVQSPHPTCCCIRATDYIRCRGCRGTRKTRQKRIFSLQSDGRNYGRDEQRQKLDKIRSPDRSWTGLDDRYHCSSTLP